MGTESNFTQHMARHLLNHYFLNKKVMAKTLGIPYRTLLRIFNGQSYPGDVQRTMNAIATYCMRHSIPPEELFAGCVPLS